MTTSDGQTTGADPATFTLQRVQGMLGLSRTVITGLIAAGFVTPSRGRRNEHRFTFQDLMLLRTAHALRTAQIPPRKILHALTRLQAALPAEVPLTGLRITAVGADVAVRDRNGRLEADSGQLLLDFDVTPQAGSVVLLDRAVAQAQAPAPVPASTPAAAPDAFAWVRRAQALEAADPDAAQAAYLQALAQAPDHVEATLNLGALWCEAERFADVVALSERALQHGVRSACVHFNHALALDSLQRTDEALAAYGRSLELDPTLADAHYNIGRLREQLGDQRGALRHFNAYRRLQKQ